MISASMFLPNQFYSICTLIVIIYSDCYLLGVEDHSGFKVSYNYIHILNSFRICVTMLWLTYVLTNEINIDFLGRGCKSKVLDSSSKLCYFNERMMIQVHR